MKRRATAAVSYLKRLRACLACGAKPMLAILPSGWFKCPNPECGAETSLEPGGAVKRDPQSPNYFLKK